MSDSSSPTTTAAQWQALEATPEFRALLARKSRFIIGGTIFFMTYYLALPILVGWFPELMKQKTWGQLNWAYLFALSQFFMAWVMAFIYVRTAATWDRDAAAILSNSSH
jgi:uncharacterized membrane protein (DUF485 family)